MKIERNNKWTRLDNAALIYTSTLSKDYAYNFRVSVTLKENVNKTDLLTALHNTLKRFPSFSYRLKNGLYWSYLEKIDVLPELSEFGPLRPLPFKGNKGYLFTLSCDSSHICLDVFHSLCDGVGAMTFLLSIAGEYLRIHNGTNISYNSWVIDPCMSPKEEEIRDGFDSFDSGYGSLEKSEKAFHYKGQVENRGRLNNTRVVFDTASLLDVSRSMGCTVTDLLTSAMILSLQRLRDEQKASSSPFIKVSVPVNLRKYFPEKTLRNFSSYVNLGIDVSCGNYTLEEVIKEIRLQKGLQTMPRHLEAKVNGNVKLEGILPIRCIPRVLKKEIMAVFARIKGDRFCSQTLSNLGNIVLPDEMSSEVDSLDFQLGRQCSNFGAVGCVSFGGKTVLNFSRMIVEDRFEEYFLEEMSGLGIVPVSVESSVPARRSVSKGISYRLARTLSCVGQTIVAILLFPISFLCMMNARLLSIFGPLMLI